MIDNTPSCCCGNTSTTENNEAADTRGARNLLDSPADDRGLRSDRTPGPILRT